MRSVGPAITAPAVEEGADERIHAGVSPVLPEDEGVPARDVENVRFRDDFREELVIAVVVAQIQVPVLDPDGLQGAVVLRELALAGGTVWIGCVRDDERPRVRLPDQRAEVREDLRARAHGGEEEFHAGSIRRLRIHPQRPVLLRRGRKCIVARREERAFLEREREVRGIVDGETVTAGKLEDQVFGRVIGEANDGKL